METNHVNILCHKIEEIIQTYFAVECLNSNGIIDDNAKMKDVKDFAMRLNSAIEAEVRRSVSQIAEGGHHVDA